MKRTLTLIAALVLMAGTAWGQRPILLFDSRTMSTVDKTLTGVVDTLPTNNTGTGMGFRLPVGNLSGDSVLVIVLQDTVTGKVTTVQGRRIIIEGRSYVDTTKLRLDTLEHIIGGPISGYVQWKGHIQFSTKVDTVRRYDTLEVGTFPIDVGGMLEYRFRTTAVDTTGWGALHSGRQEKVEWQIWGKQ